MENETRDWETNPHLYLQDDEGNFVLKKDGTPKKKAGRPQTTTEKAIKAARSTVGRKQRNIEKLEQKLNNARQSFKKQKETIQKLDQTLEGPITEDELDTLPKAVKENLNNHKVLFHANEGPQTNFLAASEKDVLYGGAAGGGKSYAMIIDPLRNCHKKAHRALILRRSMPELREMIDKSRELYPQAFPGAKFREVEKLWNFPSGAKVEFGFLERDADVYRYQGQAYSWIGFDEITHLPNRVCLELSCFTSKNNRPHHHHLLTLHG
jgi:hypothetical protein